MTEYRRLLKPFIIARDDLSPETLKTYRVRVSQFFDYCDESSFDVGTATESDLRDYLKYRARVVGNKPSTIGGALNSVHQFYLWANQNGHLQNFPTSELRLKPTAPEPRATLTVEELKKLFLSAPTPHHRALIGLLGFAGLRVEQVCSLNIAHVRRDSHPVEVINEQRRGARHNIRILLPDQVAAAVDEAIGERRSGPLLLTGYSNRLNRASAGRMVESARARAKIGVAVSPLSLSFTLRALAAEHGFSYLGVVAAVGEVHSTRSRRWTQHLTPSNAEHAALRLGRLAFDAEDPTLSLLAEAEVLLGESDLHPAIAVMCAGSAFERHLRHLSRSRKIEFQTPENKLQIHHYRDRLMSIKTFTKAEARQIAWVEALRNDAAHGWLENVTRNDAVLRLT